MAEPIRPTTARRTKVVTTGYEYVVHLGGPVPSIAQAAVKAAELGLETNMESNGSNPIDGTLTVRARGHFANETRAREAFDNFSEFLRTYS